MKLDWNSDKLYDPALSCMGFDKYCNSSGYVLRRKTDNEIMSQLFRELNKLLKVKERMMDVRCKIYFFSSDTLVFTACIDERSTLFNGRFYCTTMALKKLIDDISNAYDYEKIKNNNKKDNNKIISGTDSLRNFINMHVTPLLNNEDSLYLHGVVYVDNSGKVEKVNIRQTVRGTSIIPQDVITQFNCVYKNIIRWNTNKERTRFEPIPINMLILKR